MSRLRAQLVNGQALAAVARELELGERLKLGSGELKSGGFRRDSILADAFEALIAAVYLDGGFDACRTVVRTLFADRVAALPRASKDAKTRLQEWLQAQGWPLPHYELVATEGEEHARIFEVNCVISEPVAVAALKGLNVALAGHGIPMKPSSTCSRASRGRASSASHNQSAGHTPRCFAMNPNFTSIPSRSRPRLFLECLVPPSA